MTPFLYRVLELEKEGHTTSDAQGVAMLEKLSDEPEDDDGVEPWELESAEALSAVLSYVLESEREDFLEQCEENGITEAEALANPHKLNHVYAFAVKVMGGSAHA